MRQDKTWNALVCVNRVCVKMGHFEHFNDRSSRSKHNNLTNVSFFSSTFWALFVGMDSHFALCSDLFNKYLDDKGDTFKPVNIDNLFLRKSC